MHNLKVSETHATSIRLPLSTLDRFDEEARRRDIPRSSLIRLVLTHYLAELDKIPAPTAVPVRLFE